LLSWLPAFDGIDGDNVVRPFGESKPGFGHNGILGQYFKAGPECAFTQIGFFAQADLNLGYFNYVVIGGLLFDFLYHISD
jgi:hypothetical protein